MTRARSAAAAVLVGLLTACLAAGLTPSPGAAIVARDAPASTASAPAAPSPQTTPATGPAIQREPVGTVEEARTGPVDLSTLEPGDLVPMSALPAPPARPRIPMREQRAGIPARANVLEIPSLNAAVRIEPAQIRGGSMVVPSTLTRVGWMTSSPSPGASRGTTVLAGHRDGLRHGVRRGPLFDLETVRVGAVMRVRWRGEVTRYRVTSVRAYERRALPARLMRTQGAHELGVLTCVGPLVMGADGLLHWSRNVVAFAQQIG